MFFLLQVEGRHWRIGATSSNRWPRRLVKVKMRTLGTSIYPGIDARAAATSRAQLVGRERPLDQMRLIRSVTRLILAVQDSRGMGSHLEVE
jgi:hypothetical protein